MSPGGRLDGKGKRWGLVNSGRLEEDLLLGRTESVLGAPTEGARWQRRSCRATAARLYVSGTAVAPRPGSVVSVSAMGRSQASISSCLSSAMRG